MEQVLLEKLIVTQLVNQFPAFHGTRRFITVFTRSCHRFLFWARYIQFTSSRHYLPKIRSNIVFPSMSRSSELSLSFGFSDILLYRQPTVCLPRRRSAGSLSPPSRRRVRRRPLPKGPGSRCLRTLQRLQAAETCLPHCAHRTPAEQKGEMERCEREEGHYT